MYYIVLIYLFLIIQSYVDLIFSFLYLLLIPIHPRFSSEKIFNYKNKYYNLLIYFLFIVSSLYFERYILILLLFFVKFEDVNKIKKDLKNEKWKKIPLKYKKYYEKDYVEYLFKHKNIKILNNYLDKMNYEQRDLFFNLTGQFHRAKNINTDISIAYSINPSDYIIKNTDYKRSSDIDYNFKNNYKKDIVKIFDASCCNCGSTKDLELDHFFIPKSMGGNFIMYHKKGFKVVNCILLCSTCNKSKSNKQDFFKKETIYKLQLKLSRLQRAINDRKYYV